MGPVFVRWYNKVVEGVLVKEAGLMGMTVVSIPIQGVQADALFQPNHVYKTMQEACGEYPKHYPTQEELTHPVHPDKSLSQFIKESIDEIKKMEDDVDYCTLQMFKIEHWDHNRNMLQLDYWQEYDKMFHAYMRKRVNMMKNYQPQLTMQMEHPATPDECMKPLNHYTVTELTLF